MRPVGASGSSRPLAVGSDRLGSVGGAELRREVEHLEQPTEADVLPGHHAELEDLRVGKGGAQLVEERIVDRVVVDGELLGVAECQPLTRRERVLTVAYSLVIPLIADRKLEAWPALETSRQVVTRQWLSVAGVLLAIGIITALSAIPFGLGPIWTLPMGITTIGVLYRELFGVLNHSRRDADGSVSQLRPKGLVRGSPTKRP
jgi:hypothetical protein